MYTNILIPTDGSESAGKVVLHAIALAQRIGAKVTMLTVSPPFYSFATDTQMIEDTPAQYQARMQEHAEKVLGAVAHAAHAAVSHARRSRSSMSIPNKRLSISLSRKVAT